MRHMYLCYLYNADETSDFHHIKTVTGSIYFQIQRRSDWTLCHSYRKKLSLGW